MVLLFAHSLASPILGDWDIYTVFPVQWPASCLLYFLQQCCEQIDENLLLTLLSSQYWWSAPGAASSARVFRASLTSSSVTIGSSPSLLPAVNVVCNLPFLLYRFSVYSLHLCFTSSSSFVINFPSLFFNDPILDLKFLVISFNFLYTFLVLPILFSSSSSLHMVVLWLSPYLFSLVFGNWYSWLWFLLAGLADLPLPSDSNFSSLRSNFYCLVGQPKLPFLFAIFFRAMFLSASSLIIPFICCHCSFRIFHRRSVLQRIYYYTDSIIEKVGCHVKFWCGFCFLHFFV